jgi:diguanylate cyclase (GGDEF)-like protein
VPTVAASHFVIDLPTLFALTVFLSAIGGLLLLFSWAQNRGTPALALWGIGYLFGSAGAALLATPGFIPNSWSVCAANTLMCGAYGMMWAGARSFEGRRIYAPLIAVGAAIWVAAFQFESFAQSPQARIALVSIILASYALISRWPTLALVVMHAGFQLARIPFASALTLSMATGQPHGLVASVMAFEALFVTFCLPFLRVAMTKERAELEQRRAALTDPLTGVANRRAFFDRGGSLLERTVADRRPAALLLFDLDRFKEVNDTAGHQAGDRVLKAFGDLVAGSMRPDDLFGRLGGEEFACLLANVSMAEALQTAERLRREFEAMRFPGPAASATVSVGVAMASDACRNLPTLLATADRALYRAKADGRNRVAPARPILVDTRGHETARQSVKIDKPAAIVAPVAG